MDEYNKTSQSDKENVPQEFNVSKSAIVSIIITMFIFSIPFLVCLTIPFWPSAGNGDISDYLILLFIAGLWSLIMGMLFSFYRIACHSDIVIDEDGLWYKEKGKALGLVPWNQIFKIIIRKEFLFALDANEQRLIRIHHSLQNYEDLKKILTQTTQDNITKREAQDTRLTREFCISKKNITDKHLFFLMTLTFSLLLIAFLFYLSSQLSINSLSATAVVILYIVSCTFYGLPTIAISFACILFGLKSKRLPHASIVLDNDGLWYKHVPKTSGLVPWDIIHKLKERHYQQCLDIYDFNGNKVMRAEYELTDFILLRNRLLDNVAHNYKTELADCFGSNIRRPLAYGAILVLIFLSGYFGGSLNHDTSLSVYLGALACAIVLIGMYLFSVSKISIQDKKFFFICPIKKDVVDFADIKSFELDDSYDEGMRGSSVHLSTYDDKVYSLSAYACVDAHVLYLALKKAMPENQRIYDDNK